MGAPGEQSPGATRPGITASWAKPSSSNAASISQQARQSVVVYNMTMAFPTLSLPMANEDSEET